MPDPRDDWFWVLQQLLRPENRRKLVGALAQAYDPGRPRADEKPPGYWAVEDLRNNGLLGIPGVTLGTVGSGLEWLGERLSAPVATGRGQLASGLPEGVLEALANVPIVDPAGVTPLGGMTAIQARMLGRLGLAQRQVGAPVTPWGDPSVLAEAQKGVGPLEAVAYGMLNDPTTLLGFGGGPFRSLARGLPKLVGPIAPTEWPSAVGPAAQTLGAQSPQLEAGLLGLGKAADVFNLPFQKAGEAATSAMRGVGSLISKTPAAGLLEESNTSIVDRAIQGLEDIISNIPKGTAGFSFPIAGMGKYAIPKLRGSYLPNIKLAADMLEKRWAALEALIARNIREGADPIELAGDMNLMHLAKSSVQEQSDFLAGRWKDKFDLRGPPGETPEEKMLRELDLSRAGGTYQSWYDQSNRIIDAVQQSIQGHVGKIDVPMSPQHREALRFFNIYTQRVQQLITEARDGVKAIRDLEAAGRYTRDEAGLLIDSLYRGRNAGMVDAYSYAVRDMQKAFGMSDEAAALATQKSLDEFTERFGGLLLEATGGPAGMGFMSQGQRSVFEQLAPQWTGNVADVQIAVYRIAELLPKAIKELPVDPTTNLPWDLGEAWGLLQTKAVAAGLKPIPDLGVATSKQFQKALADLTKKGLTDAEAVGSIQNTLDKWAPRGDILTADPLRLAIGPTRDEYLRVLEGGGGGGLRNVLGAALRPVNLSNRALKENWLATAGYLLTNWASAVVINLFDNPKQAAESLRLLPDLVRKFRYGTRNPGALQSVDLLPAYSQEVLKAYGIKSVPIELGGNAYWAGTMNNVSDVLTAHERMGWKGRLLMGAATAPSPDPITFSLYTGLYALKGDEVVRTTRNLSSIIEFSVRLGVYDVRLPQAVQQRFPKFLDELGKVLDESFNLYGESLGPSSGQKFEVLEAIHRTQGAMSPEVLQGILRESNVPSKVLRQATDLWRNVIQEASAEAVGHANRLHVNYLNYTNIEHFIDNIIPFTRWAIRMIPNFRDILVGNPGFTLGLARLSGVNRKNAEELGLPSRYENMIMVEGDLGRALAKILGQEEGGKQWVNPSRLINPYETNVSALERGRYASNPVQAFVEAFPFRPMPTYQIPAQIISGYAGRAVPAISGVMPFGPSTPIPTLGRFTPMLGGEEAFQGVLRTMAEALGLSPYSYKEAAIGRRLGEMAGAETGYVDHPLYQAARGTKSGPLYERARQSVNTERSLESMASFVSPLGLSMLSPQELQVAAAQKTLPRGRRDTPEKQAEFEAALNKAPWAAAPIGAQGGTLERRAQYVFDIFQNPAVLFPDAHPEVATQLAQALKRYDDAASPEAKKSILRSNPLVGAALQRRSQMIGGQGKDNMMQKYIEWRQTIHPKERVEGEEAFMRQFIEWYVRQGGR